MAASMAKTAMRKPIPVAAAILASGLFVGENWPIYALVPLAVLMAALVYGTFGFVRTVPMLMTAIGYSRSASTGQASERSVPDRLHSLPLRMPLFQQIEGVIVLFVVGIAIVGAANGG